MSKLELIRQLTESLGHMINLLHGNTNYNYDDRQKLIEKAFKIKTEANCFINEIEKTMEKTE